MDITQIMQHITQNKPDISPSSLKSYAHHIRRLQKSQNEYTLEIFLDYDKVIDTLRKFKSYLTKRNYLNAIIVLLLNNPLFAKVITKYQALRDTYNTQYETEQRTRVRSEKQEKNWITTAEIDDIKKALEQDIEENRDIEQTLQHYFMLCFWTKHPLRNDLKNTKIISRHHYQELRTHNDLLGHNYLINDELPFLSIGDYKTCKTYGVKTLYINGELKTVLRHYLQYNRTNYLLYNIKNHEPMSSHDITLAFNKLFKKYTDKNIGTTMLRHVVVSEKFNTALTQMESLAKQMGHDLSTSQKIYCKTV